MTDVIERCQQKILVTVEDRSHFNKLSLIEDQRADTIRSELLNQVLPFTPMTGSTLRSDNAPSFQSLMLEAEREDSIWKKYSLSWELGETHNVNKNPISENKIREVEKELIKFKGCGGPISKLDLIQVERIVNSRVRHHGNTAKEILLRRAAMDHQPLNIDDKTISGKVASLRKENHVAMKDHHAKRGRKEVSKVEYKVGDQVLIQDTLSKHQLREVHTVVEVDGNENIRVKKFENRMRQKSLKVKHSQLIPYFISRPGPEQPAGDGEIDLEKVAKEYEGTPKRPRMTNSEDEDSILNNNIVHVPDSDSSGSSGANSSNNEPEVEVIDKTEQVRVHLVRILIS